MRRIVVLVNGVPGAGKTTLARALSAELGLPLLSKDVIKECLFDWVGVGDRDWSMKLGAASSESIWALLRDCPQGAILEQPFSRPEYVVKGLDRAGVDHHYEIWCEVDPDVAHQRFVGRAPSRHPGHLSQQEIANGRQQAFGGPVGLGEVLRVRTDGPVDIAAIASRIRGSRPVDAVAWVHRCGDKLLMVRAKGKDVFYLPGGKREAGESDIGALTREVREELNIDLQPRTVSLCTVITAPAHGYEDGRAVRLICYFADATGDPVPGAEIEELDWIGGDGFDRCPPAGRMLLAELGLVAGTG